MRSAARTARNITCWSWPGCSTAGCAVSEEMGQLGETRLFLMGALLLADELSDLRGRLSVVQAELARFQSDQARVETRAVGALENAAKRIEKLAQG